MRVLVLSSFTKSLAWFRMELLDELMAAGHEVFAMGSNDDGSRDYGFAERGITYRPFAVSRHGLNPFEDLRTYRELKSAIAGIAPDRIFVYQAKTVVYGTFAARACGVRGVYPLIAGLGSVFRGHGLKHRAVGAVLSRQYKAAFRRSAAVFVQNADDREVLVSSGMLPLDKVIMLNGSGVNLDRFALAPLPQEPVFLFVGRLLRDKGIAEYLEAASEIRTRYPRARCLVVGPYDTNPSALGPADMKKHEDSGAIEYFGELVDVRPAIAQSSVFVLPSYHEGTPKSVLEAMAMGRPIITTDAPGCKETVTEGVNGYLVAAGDARALAERMKCFIDDPSLAEKMGRESRRIAEDKYDVHAVNRVIMETMGLVAQGPKNASVLPSESERA